MTTTEYARTLGILPLTETEKLVLLEIFNSRRGMGLQNLLEKILTGSDSRRWPARREATLVLSVYKAVESLLAEEMISGDRQCYTINVTGVCELLLSEDLVCEGLPTAQVQTCAHPKGQCADIGREGGESKASPSEKFAGERGLPQGTPKYEGVISPNPPAIQDSCGTVDGHGTELEASKLPMSTGNAAAPSSQRGVLNGTMAPVITRLSEYQASPAGIKFGSISSSPLKEPGPIAANSGEVPSPSGASPLSTDSATFHTQRAVTPKDVHVTQAASRESDRHPVAPETLGRAQERNGCAARTDMPCNHDARPADVPRASAVFSGTTIQEIDECVDRATEAVRKKCEGKLLSFPEPDRDYAGSGMSKARFDYEVQEGIGRRDDGNGDDAA